MSLTPALIRERLTPKLQADDECLVFMGARARKGYGHMTICGKNYRTHRLAWIAAYGPIPEGMCVLHHCDNPPCCNVDHLWLGTSADNNADMIAKDRQYQRPKTLCLHGHPFEGSNLYVDPKGRRSCRTCRRVKARAWRRSLRRLTP
jgi:HNH endonuclease